jgi:hypothetical protein
MEFDGEAFVERFMSFFNNRDPEGISAMMTDDVVRRSRLARSPGARGYLARQRFVRSMSTCSPGSRTRTGLSSATSPVPSTWWWSRW